MASNMIPIAPSGVTFGPICPQVAVPLNPRVRGHAQAAIDGQQNDCPSIFDCAICSDVIRCGAAAHTGGNFLSGPEHTDILL